MQRYFINNQNVNEQIVRIIGDDFHHITRVMRMNIGDKIIVVNENGETAVTKISEITNDSVIGIVVEWKNEDKELPITVTIASGLPKGDKLEWIVQKGTELGATEFIPFVAARSVVKWDNKKASKKIDRLQKIAKEAAEQSHRTRIPIIHESMTLLELIQCGERFDYKLIAYEEEAKQGEKAKFAEVLSKMKAGQSLLFVFGPEGGLTSEEVDKLSEAGFISCGLGPRILRTETAPLYALAAISYQVELLR